MTEIHYALYVHIKEYLHTEFSQLTDNPENLTWLSDSFIIFEFFWSTPFRFTDSSKDCPFSANGCIELLSAKITVHVASKTTFDKL